MKTTRSLLAAVPVSIGATSGWSCLVAAVAICLMGGWATHAAAVVISVNFEGAQNQSNYGDLSQHGPLVTSTAGAVQVNNWNNAQGPVGSAGSLLNSAGATTGAGVSWSASNVYNAYSGTPPTSTQDYNLMQGYLDYFSGGSPINGNPDFVTVTGLGSAFTSGGYEVLVYQNTDSVGSFGYTITDSNANTNFAYGRQLTAGGGNYPLGGPNGYIGSTSTSPAGPATAANYVMLTGFNGASFTLNGLTGTTGDGRARIAGFQIVANPVPEPASLVLLGLGALGLFVVVRRRA